VNAQEIPVIGNEERFYGYITGLGLEAKYDPLYCGIPKLYATFEKGDETEVWIVPDWYLFRILSDHLVSMAETRESGEEYGYDKLWISRPEGSGWIVDLP